MKRKILRLWAEYESDDAVYPVIEPISIATAIKVIEEVLNKKEEKIHQHEKVTENTTIEGREKFIGETT